VATGAVGVDKWYMAHLVDALNAPVTGIARASATVEYASQDEVAWTAAVMADADWKEAGGGDYEFRVGEDEYAGAYEYEVRLTATGIRPFLMTVDVAAGGATGTKAWSAGGYISAAIAKAVSAGGYILASITKQVSAGGYILAEFTKPITAGGYVLAELTKAISSGGYISAELVKALQVGGYISAATAKAISGGGYVSGVVTKAFSAGGNVAGTVLWTAGGYVEGAGMKGFSAGGYVADIASTRAIIITVRGARS